MSPGLPAPQRRMLRRRLYEMTWGPRRVFLRKTTHNQRRDRWEVWPEGGEEAKARRFAHLGEAEAWALGWLWHANGAPELPQVRLDPRRRRTPASARDVLPKRPKVRLGLPKGHRFRALDLSPAGQYWTDL